MMKESSAAIGEAAPNSRPRNCSVSVGVSSSPEIDDDRNIKIQNRAQWLRAAVLGANDGLVTTASLMMGVGAVKTDAKTMVMSGIAALVAGACSMAIGEFVSVQTQREAELSNLKREKEIKTSLEEFEEPSCMDTSNSSRSTSSSSRNGSPLVISRREKESLPSPIQAAFASAIAFSVGALFPLISTAFITEYMIRVGVLAGVSSLALIMFGAIGAYYGRSSLVKGSVTVLMGGWLAMLVTFGLLRLFSAAAGI